MKNSNAMSDIAQIYSEVTQEDKKKHDLRIGKSAS